MKHVLIYFIGFALIAAPSFSLAAWTCQPDYSSATPFADCAEATSSGVIGPGNINNSALYNVGSTHSASTASNQFDQFSAVEKYQLLLKLEQVFNIIY